MKNWTEEEIKLFDIFDNATIAKITGRTLTAVASKRATVNRYDPFKLYKCSVCGRMFAPPDIGDWVYKRVYHGRLKYFCRYNCLRTWDNEHSGKEKTVK